MTCHKEALGVELKVLNKSGLSLQAFGASQKGKFSACS